MIEATEKSQARQMALVGIRVMGMLVDPSNTTYQSFRSKTAIRLGYSEAFMPEGNSPSFPYSMLKSPL